ncbi:MAG: Ig-like domain-containing protein [Rhodothermia bacterium]|nr:Ig-like domain-containing protein [Rhodothermia bacterium]
MRPPNNTVNYSGNTVELIFNEYVDEASFLQALEITPEPASEPDLRWDGRRVSIRFLESLEDNTTYIITIGSRLRDIRNVSLKAPITRAFSTGPQINTARISGRIVDPFDGTGVAAMQVFAYAISDTTASGRLPDRPLYQTETDDSGNFRFEYLSSRPYFVVGVRDRNGNRLPDNMELLAVPPNLQLNADTTTAGTPAPWYAAVFDTVRPTVRRVEALSSARVSLRYPEDVMVNTDSVNTWVVTDPSETTIGTARSVYQPFDDPRAAVVFLQPLPRGDYLLTPGFVADSAGNVGARQIMEFSSDGRIDTASVQLAVFTPQPETDVVSLPIHDRAGLKLTAPADTSFVLNRLTVADTSGSPIDFLLSTPNMVDYSITVAELPGGGLFDLHWRTPDIEDADTLRSQRYFQNSLRDVGSVTGMLSGYPDSSEVVVQAISRSARLPEASVQTHGERSFELQGLRPGTYRLRIFRDDNRNDRWDPGQITPYIPAEPIFWTSDSLRVRARWETETGTIDVEEFIPRPR